DRADAKHLGLRTVGRDALSRAGGAEIRIAGQVAVFEHHLLDVVAVGADELAAPVVEAHAVLGAAAGRREGPGPRIAGDIAAVDRHWGGLFVAGGNDLAARAARGPMN